MNKFVGLVIIICLFSCKSTSIAQEKQDTKTIKDKIVEKKTETPDYKKIKLGDPTDNERTHLDLNTVSQVKPGTIQLEGLVETFYKNTAICEKPYKAAIKIKVSQIIESGSGLVKTLSKDQEITFGFIPGVYTKDLEVLQKKMQPGRKLSILVRQGLCPDFGDNAVFEIVRYAIKW